MQVHYIVNQYRIAIKMYNDSTLHYMLPEICTNGHAAEQHAT